MFLDDFDDLPQNMSASGIIEGGCDDLDMDDLDAIQDQLEEELPSMPT